MADSEQQVAMLEETDVPHAQVIVENGEIMTVAQTHEVDNGGMGEDILQQALDEASGGYDNTDVEYTTEENIAVVADGNGTLSDANGVTYSYVTAVPTETQLETQTIPQTIPAAHTTQPGQSLIRINPNTQAQVAGVSQVVTLPHPNTVVTNQQNVSENCQQPQVVQVIRPPQHVVQQVVQPQTLPTNIIQGLPPQPQGGAPQIQQTHVQLSQTDSGTPGSITVLTNSGVGGEPLGSSGNPIRIIQQGNKYTSVQQLTPEQVAQIMQVVQQQQLAQTTTAGGGSSVLFNPQTQTRIVYRVIYPSELHSKTTGVPGTSVTGLAKAAPKTITVPTQMLTLGSSRRPYRKRLKDEDDKVDGPELTREEKEMKKKHRPRTRSGRVSRPPKHMVQDYKHIHHLDWEEDHDDSDGGYSDYKVTDDEEAEKRNLLESALLDTSINSSKPKKFPCDKCEKAYIGAAGLARHYRLNADHGDPEEVCPTGRGRMSINGGDGIASFADDSSTQDSISSTASLPTTMAQIPIIGTPITLSTATEALPVEEPGLPPDLSPHTAPATTSAPVPTPAAPVVLASPSKPTAPRGAARAKQYYVQENTPTRRKSRLKELVRQCTDEELMEVVLPRLSRVITLWEFLLMKVERGRPSRPDIGDMLTEYEGLHKQVEKMCGDYLNPLLDNPERPMERHNNVLQMKNPVIAESLGLNMGKYSVRDVPKRDDSTFQYKLLTSTPNNIATPNVYVGHGSGKRTIQLVTPDQLVLADSSTKRQRISEPCITSVTQTSGIVTVSLANGVFSEEPGNPLETMQASGDEVLSFQQPQGESTDIPQSTDAMQANITEVPTATSEETGLIEVTPLVERPTLMPIGGEELNGVSEQEDVVLDANIKQESEEAETIISIATGHHKDPTAGADIVACSGTTIPQSIQVNEHGIAVSELCIPESKEPEEVAPDAVTTDLMPPDSATVPVSAEDGSLPPLASDQMDQVVEVQQAGGDEVVPQQNDMQVKELKEKKEQLQSQVLCVDQMAEIASGGDPQPQTVMVSAGDPQLQAMVVSAGDSQSQSMMVSAGDPQPQTVMVSAGVEHQQQQQNTTQQVLSEDGQTVLYTDDGGQTFYQQAGGVIVDQTQTQQMTMEATGPQFVSMETPEGLVEGQLVTNEDGTQFLIPHQETQEQAVYQTPDGLLVIQNPDGTLRILNNGDPQIPLETVQALLAGDGQIQVENTMEQVT